MYAKKVIVALCAVIVALLPVAVRSVGTSMWSSLGHFYTSLAYAYFIALVAMLAASRQIADYSKYFVFALVASIALFLSELWSVGSPQAMATLGFVGVLQGTVAGIALAYGVAQFLVGTRAVEREVVEVQHGYDQFSEGVTAANSDSESI